MNQEEYRDKYKDFAHKQETKKRCPECNGIGMVSFWQGDVEYWQRCSRCNRPREKGE